MLHGKLALTYLSSSSSLVQTGQLARVITYDKSMLWCMIYRYLGYANGELGTLYNR